MENPRQEECCFHDQSSSSGISKEICTGKLYHFTQNGSCFLMKPDVEKPSSSFALCSSHFNEHDYCCDSVSSDHNYCAVDRSAENSAHLSGLEPANNVTFPTTDNESMKSSYTLWNPCNKETTLSYSVFFNIILMKCLHDIL